MELTKNWAQFEKMKYVPPKVEYYVFNKCQK